MSAAWELTPREQEVAELLRDGASYTEMAQRLGISRGSIKNRAHLVRVKLGLPQLRPPKVVLPGYDPEDTPPVVTPAQLACDHHWETDEELDETLCVECLVHFEAIYPEPAP